MPTSATCTNPDCPRYGEVRAITAEVGSSSTCECGHRFRYDRIERAVKTPPEATVRRPPPGERNIERR